MTRLHSSKLPSSKRRRTTAILAEAMEPRRLLSTYIVNTLSDAASPGPGLTSLRQAVAAANTHAGPDTITFDPKVFAPGSQHTITLTQGPINFTDTSGSTTVTGPGAAVAAVNGNAKSRIFTINAGMNVSLSGLTITGGSATAADANGNTYGGAILNAGTLSIANSTLTGNSVDASGYVVDHGDGDAIPGDGLGGAIYSTGALTISGSTLSSNSVIVTAEFNASEGTTAGGAYGGAIYDTGPLSLTNSTISGNTTTGFTNQNVPYGGPAEGGGIYATGVVTITSSFITGNSAVGGTGNSASADGADAVGGGIWAGASLSITDSTVNGNSLQAGNSGSDSGFGGAARGGGIFAGGDVTVWGSTIAQNKATGGVATESNNPAPVTSGGGGLYAAASVNLVDDQINNNTLTGGPDLLTAGGGVFAGGNLIMQRDTVQGNIATAAVQQLVSAGQGGGIAAGGGVAATSNANISNSTISGNTALGGTGKYAYNIYPANYGGDAQGGGLFTSSSCTITNSTIALNAAKGGVGGHGDIESGTGQAGAAGGNGAGGGIYTTGTLVLADSTVSGNTVAAGAGGAGASGDGYTAPAGPPGTATADGIDIAAGSTTLTNSIVAANGTMDIAGNANASSGFNLIGIGGGLANGVNGNQVGVTNPQLSPLANNGGPTQTMLPQPGSPAINAGSNALIPSGVTADQRGLPRIANGTVDIGSVEVQPPSVPLTGTVIGTSGSYQNDGNTIAKAVDGNLSTFFDAPGANGNWVGLDLGTVAQITSISYAPRNGWSGYASRMVGGIFQASNTADFSSGVVNLYTVTSAPPANVLTTVNVNNPGTFRYVRYLSPNGSYGNIAEMKFSGIPSIAPAPLIGTIIGTSGSYQNKGNTIAKVFDGNLNTFFDAPGPNGNWAGLDLGSTKVITSISYAPRGGFAGRMVGGVFQGANTADFSDAATLYTITKAPFVGLLTTVSITNLAAFRYVRYLSPAGSYGNIAEAQFFGTTPAVTKLTGTVIGTSGSYQNSGNTIAKVFDGNLATFFDAPGPNGNWAGLDLGSANVITSISYAPRGGWSGYAQRMVGGVFQGSNAADFSNATTLYTITTTPVAGSLTTISITNPGAFRYVRYLSPDGSYGNIAEAQFFGTPQTDPLIPVLQHALDVAQTQTAKTIASVGNSSNYPQYTLSNGSWSWVNVAHWTSGFFPGLLWQLYDATGNAYYKTEATQFTQPIAAADTQTMDNGFRIYNTFLPLLQQNPGDTNSINVMLTAAKAKMTTYNATVGAFEAWRTSTSGNPKANFNVLMDLIMDSNLLFWASKQTGDVSYYNAAVQNAITEENYLVRPDGSSAQFAYFDSSTGQFIDNETYEGYSADSTWSRGQAWGIYGFTECAAATSRADFLATAEKMADWYIAHLPADQVPYWDFNDPAIPNSYRDTSAAATAASGLLQLSQLIQTTDPIDAARYRNAAGEMLQSLATNYLANPAQPGESVLLQGALNVPANPSLNNNGLIFGDYYFIEAINQYMSHS